MKNALQKLCAQTILGLNENDEEELELSPHARKRQAGQISTKRPGHDLYDRSCSGAVVGGAERQRERESDREPADWLIYLFKLRACVEVGGGP